MVPHVTFSWPWPFTEFNLKLWHSANAIYTLSTNHKYQHVFPQINTGIFHRMDEKRVDMQQYTYIEYILNAKKVSHHSALLSYIDYTRVWKSVIPLQYSKRFGCLRLVKAKKRIWHTAACCAHHIFFFAFTRRNHPKRFEYWNGITLF